MGIRRIATVLALVLPAATMAAEVEEGQQFETVYELDPYYSNAGVYLPLTDAPIPSLGAASEAQIYKTLLVDAFVPRYMLLEASIYPMPLLGAYLKKNHRDFYNRADLGGGVNLIESVTAGFEEPYAFSMFFGNVVNYNSPDAAPGEVNKGHIGYLFSGGNWHIKSNELIRDDWMEFEFKLKSDQVYREHRLSMSYRAGMKLHNNREITDVFYLGLRRNHLAFNQSTTLLPLLHNSNIEYTLSLDTRDAGLVEQQITIGKKWPVKRWGAAFAIDLGLIWHSNRKYSGTLADARADTFTLLLRPNLEF